VITDKLKDLILAICRERQDTWIARLKVGNRIEDIVFQYFVNRGIRAKVYDQDLLGTPNNLGVDYHAVYQVDGVIFFGGKAHKVEVKALGSPSVLEDFYLIGKCEGIDLKKKSFKAKPNREYIVIVEQDTGRLVIGQWEPVLNSTLYHTSKWLSYKVPKSLFTPLDTFIEVIRREDKINRVKPRLAPHCDLINREILLRRQARNTIWYSDSPNKKDLKLKYQGLF
jgi:G:T-mismatch repair DNA endonuclease (very short patch repair protein)